MATAFFLDPTGTPTVYADPGTDIDYAVACWLADVIFTNVVWTMLPVLAPSPYNQQINPAPVTIDGKLYDTGKVASAWVKNLVAGQSYVVNLAATFTGGRKDERSFKIVCKER